MVNYLPDGYVSPINKGVPVSAITRNCHGLISNRPALVGTQRDVVEIYFNDGSLPHPIGFWAAVRDGKLYASLSGTTDTTEGRTIYRICAVSDINDMNAPVISSEHEISFHAKPVELFSKLRDLPENTSLQELKRLLLLSDW